VDAGPREGVDGMPAQTWNFSPAPAIEISNASRGILPDDRKLDFGPYTDLVVLYVHNRK
jgi:hypothetical protein